MPSVIYHIKKVLKYFLPKSLILLSAKFINRFKTKYKKTFAQSGEDMILNTIFYKQKNGFYIDVGANNPFTQSNTHFFYRKGWRGINIDALPGSMKGFRKARPRDINLEIPISDKEEAIKYYLFSPSFFNSFSEEQAAKYNISVKGVKILTTQTLAVVFDKYVGDNVIDFLTVDVEGWDLQVLKSNNWEKYKPKVIVIEYFKESSWEINDLEIANYIIEKGYRFYCNSPTNAFFVEEGFSKWRFKKSHS